MVSLLALTVFATIDQAAISGLKHAAAICDPQYECGGVVRAVPGGFEPSALISSKKPFGVDLGEFYARDVVADFHTHICSIHNRVFADFFSASDAIVNHELHTVGYMLSLCDWNIRRFDPSQDDRDDEEVHFHSGKVIYLTVGHIVGWVPDDSTTELLRAADPAAVPVYVPPVTAFSLSSAGQLAETADAHACVREEADDPLDLKRVRPSRATAK